MKINLEDRKQVYIFVVSKDERLKFYTTINYAQKQ